MTDLGWMDSALCAQVGAAEDHWFPAKGAGTRAGRSVCTACPVQPECRDYAAGEAFGTWGGLTAHERKQMKRREVAA